MMAFNTDKQSDLQYSLLDEIEHELKPDIENNVSESYDEFNEVLEVNCIKKGKKSSNNSNVNVGLKNHCYTNKLFIIENEAMKENEGVKSFARGDDVEFRASMRRMEFQQARRSSFHRSLTIRHTDFNKSDDDSSSSAAPPVAGFSTTVSGYPASCSKFEHQSSIPEVKEESKDQVCLVWHNDKF